MALYKKSYQLFTVTALAVALAACGGDSDSDSSSSAGTKTGTVSVGLTDAPSAEFESVNIAVTALELKPAEGEAIRIEVTADEYINLLDYQSGKVLDLLDDYELEAGEYNWIRLYLADGDLAPELSLKGGPVEIPLEVPSADQTGLKLNRGFTVTAGGTVDLTIDFDAAKSVVQTGNGTFKLKPTLRIVDNSEVGTIEGTVDQSLFTCVVNDKFGNVYVFEGGDVTPDDLDNSDPDPLIIAPVVLDADSNTGYSFTAAFLPSGTYTIAYTQDDDVFYGTDGQPQDDLLNFTNTQNVEVNADQTTTVNLDPEVGPTSGGTVTPSC